MRRPFGASSRLQRNIVDNYRLHGVFERLGHVKPRRRQDVLQSLPNRHTDLTDVLVLWVLNYYRLQRRLDPAVAEG